MVARLLHIHGSVLAFLSISELLKFALFFLVMTPIPRILRYHSDSSITFDLNTILLNIMKKLFLPLFIIIVVLPLSTLLSGCNVKGFFTTYDDDPVYESPVAQDAADGKSGVDVADASPGATTFKQVCATCHQGKGQGVPGTYPPLAGSALAQNADVTKPIRIVLYGLQGPIERNGKTYNGVMAAWSQLTDQEIAEVLSYVRSSWGNTAAVVTIDEVKAVRDQTSGRSSAYTETELN